MQHKNEKGFSLVELLIVVVIIGIIATISTSFYFRARIGAENKAAVAHLALIRTAQTQYYAQHRQYGTLNDIKQSQNIELGTMVSPTVYRRGKYTYTFTTTDPQTDYLVTATRVNDNPIPFLYTLGTDGVIEGLYDF